MSNLVQSGSRGAPERVEARGFLVALRSRSPSSTAYGGGGMPCKRPQRAATCGGSPEDAESVFPRSGASR
eukprot:6988087-Pyramimonas_sp.AAC.1